MSDWRAQAKICLAAVLFFAGSNAGRAEEAEQTEREELRVVLEKLRASNADLKQQLDQREALIRKLQESLAVARTESDLFQKKWQEALLRAQTLGVNFGDADASQAQRQLIESIRSLYLAEAERQRLIEQLKRMLAAVESNSDLAAEAERTRALLAASEPAAEPAAPARSATVDAARVLDVNPKLRVAVLDVGLLQGARIGMPFLILRGDRVIARVRAVDVRRRICGALIESEESGTAVTAGDGARATGN